MIRELRLEHPATRHCMRHKLWQVRDGRAAIGDDRPWRTNAETASVAQLMATTQVDVYDEIHVYESLERAPHFFGMMKLIYEMLKPGGYLLGVTPSRYSGIALGDPGIVTLITPETLALLDRSQVAKNRERGTPLPDYSDLWHGDFKLAASEDNHVKHLFALQAVKPARTL